MSTEKMLNGGITKLLSSFSAYHLPPPEQEERHLITDLQAHAACERSPRSNFPAVDTAKGLGQHRPENCHLWWIRGDLSIGHQSSSGIKAVLSASTADEMNSSHYWSLF